MLNLCKTRVLEIVEVRVLTCRALFSLTITIHRHVTYVLSVMFWILDINLTLSHRLHRPLFNFFPASWRSYVPSAIFSLSGLDL